MNNASQTRLALVTGASRGLGFAMAAALAAKGWHVLATARTVGGLEELDNRIQAAGGSATLAPMDITDDKAMNHLASSIAERWGKLDLWVHAAIHAAPLAPAGHLDPKDFDKSVACNLRATASLIPMLEPLLRAAQGTALFLDDPRGGEKFFASYGATKAAQIALARSWQAESENIGPRILIETPKPMATATRARFFPGEDRTQLADIHEEAERVLARL
ncbi:SDR family NAD(P)-dependent oxidoreductase [Defluviimonas aestuarii]|uniref:SDR family NAD(P)-dependent oxidoreductase n=1 Tax=Albidovulum aestuarii TaxID=1130726 RepID=UPI00249AC677|nr:SDR family NAD(P)-dependent oxidoreductase [Defluviimonas aestuarii]MDI3334987.1 SDR family NAD(P)-dependent oxidoreductase [Defluviimonas aestuarii]